MVFLGTMGFGEGLGQPLEMTRREDTQRRGVLSRALLIVTSPAL
jgi:hypothetical protein